MRKIILLGIFILLVIGAVFFVPNQKAQAAGVSIGSVSQNLTSVPKFEKLEISFQVTGSVATNYYWPYDDGLYSPTYPSFAAPNNGISVNAVFTAPSGKTYTYPAFFGTTYDTQVKSNNQWFYPNGSTWRVRFAPDEVGNWQFYLTAQDASGTTSTQSTPGTFTVTAALLGNHGFVKVAKNDSRYFEFSDGTYFPGMALNSNTNDVDLYNPDLPGAHSDTFLSKLGQNGVQVTRYWLSSAAIFGTSWRNWFGLRNDYDYYLPRAGMITNGSSSNSTTPMSIMSLRYSESGTSQNTAYFDACRALLPFQQLPAVKRNTNYHIMIRYQTSGLTGPRDPTYPGWGLVVKMQSNGNWLTSCYNGGDPQNGVKISGYGQNTNGWTYLESNWNSGSNDFLPNFYIGEENVNSSTTARIDIDKVIIAEDLGGCTASNMNGCGVNINPKYSMEDLTYFADLNAYAFDHVVDLAHKYGVYLKTVIMERNEQVENEIGWDGNRATFNNTNFFGDYRTMTFGRWVQQAWWRYLQARWGYSTNIHSWEAVNEAKSGGGYDPVNGLPNHDAQVDEMGRFLHCGVFGVDLTVPHANNYKCSSVGANAHLVSTSFDVGWETSLWPSQWFPNVDYADEHLYIAKDTDANHFYDTALATYDLSLGHGAKTSGGANKPFIRGETGFINSAANTDSYTSDINADSNGIWLHNFVWGGINPGGLIEEYWYTTNHIWPSYNSTNANGFLGQYASYFNFIKNVPLNNGNYVDSGATATDINVRVWGQKDGVNHNAHLWVQNVKHLWCAVTATVGCPTTWDNSRLNGTVTVSGFAPNTSYPVEWWQFDNATALSKSTSNVTSDSTGKIVLDLTTLPATVVDVGVKIGTYATNNGPSTGSGDANGDGSINALDLKAVLTNYLKSGTSLLDQYPDSKINAMDFAVVVKRLP